MTTTTADPKSAVGDTVLFHEEGGPYAAVVAAVNEDGTYELATLGRNSLYFQHGIKESRSLEKPEKGTWTRRPNTRT